MAGPATVFRMASAIVECHTSRIKLFVLAFKKKPTCPCWDLLYLGWLNFRKWREEKGILSFWWVDGWEDSVSGILRSLPFSHRPHPPIPLWSSPGHGQRRMLSSVDTCRSLYFFFPFNLVTHCRGCSLFIFPVFSLSWLMHTAGFL